MQSTTIYLEGQCNLRCKHCLVGDDHIHPRPSLSTDRVKSVLTHLAEGGVRTITFLGGEITQYRSDIGDILDHCELLNLYVSINTNLTDLAPLEALSLKPALGNVTISLDGATETSHDFLRGKGTFTKTVANIKALQRLVDRSKTEIDVTFCLSARNCHENTAIIDLANELQINKLNVQNVSIAGRAKTFQSNLRTDARALLYAITEMILYWRLNGAIKLDYYITPLLAQYLHDRFGTPKEWANYNGCGGTSVYGYVDLYGNHLPCPAMSKEENPARGVKRSMSDLDLTVGDTKSIWNRSLFKGFDKSREKKYRNVHMTPCNTCVFSSECSPCTAAVFKDGYGSVDICAAIKVHGSEYVPDIGKYFSAQAL